MHEAGFPEGQHIALEYKGAQEYITSIAVKYTGQLSCSEETARLQADVDSMRAQITVAEILYSLWLGRLDTIRGVVYFFTRDEQPYVGLLTRRFDCKSRLFLFIDEYDGSWVWGKHTKEFLLACNIHLRGKYAIPAWEQQHTRTRPVRAIDFQGHDYIQQRVDANRLSQDQTCFIDANYISRQTDINSKMRQILIDWLIEVAWKFKLYPDTFYLTIQLLDRYLSMGHQVSRQRLQLIGLTAMWIACKLEEVHAPELRDFRYICDNAYTCEQFRQTEIQMLKRVCFQLAVPTAHAFLQRFLDVATSTHESSMPDEVRSFAEYVLMASTMCLTMYNFTNHRRAAASVMYAMKCCAWGSWNKELQRITKCKESDLYTCIDQIYQCLCDQQSSNLNCAKRAFSSTKFHRVAQTVICLSGDAIREEAS